MEGDHKLLFRVWTGKRYLSPDEMEKMKITLSPTGALVVGNSDKFLKAMSSGDFLNACIIEMSTGLYDTKGAKVFAGDILEFCGLHLLVVFEPNTGGFDFRCPRFYNQGKDVFVFDRNALAHMFKKGNIHENADLMAKTYNGE